MSKPRGSSRSWRERQERDPFVQKARKEGWRSRAVYKLEQIDQKERLLKPGMLCVDLGPDDQECAHHRSQRRVAEKVRDGLPMRSDEQWQRFLREEFSRLGEMLTVCATRDGRRVAGSSVRDCRADCAVWAAVPVPLREHQRRRARLALLLSRSSIVQLRHSAPIGHFFGVPSIDEIELEWADVVRQARRLADLDVGSGDLVDQLRVYCSAIAGTPLRSATTIGRIADQLRDEWTTTG